MGDAEDRLRRIALAFMEEANVAALPKAVLTEEGVLAQLLALRYGCTHGLGRGQVGEAHSRRVWRSSSLDELSRHAIEDGPFSASAHAGRASPGRICHVDAGGGNA